MNPKLCRSLVFDLDLEMSSDEPYFERIEESIVVTPSAVAPPVSTPPVTMPSLTPPPMDVDVVSEAVVKRCVVGRDVLDDYFNDYLDPLGDGELKRGLMQLRDKISSSRRGTPILFVENVGSEPVNGSGAHYVVGDNFSFGILSLDYTALERDLDPKDKWALERRLGLFDVMTGMFAVPTDCYARKDGHPRDDWTVVKGTLGLTYVDLQYLCIGLEEDCLDDEYPSPVQLSSYPLSVYVGREEVERVLGPQEYARVIDLLKPPKPAPPEPGEPVLADDDDLATPVGREEVEQTPETREYKMVIDILDRPKPPQRREPTLVEEDDLAYADTVAMFDPALEYSN